MPLTPTTPRRDSGLAPLPGLLLDFAALWLTGVLIGTVLFSVVTGSPLPRTSLRWFELAGLVGLRVLSAIPGALVFAACFAAIRAAPRLSAGGARFLKGLSWTVLFGFAFVTMSSWASLYATGQFLGFEAWSQGLASPALMLAHVVEIAPAALVVVPGAALSVVLLNARVVKWASSWPVARTRTLVYGVSAALVLAAGIAGAADLASARDTAAVASGLHGPTVTPHEEFVSMGMDKSGPIARLLVDAFRSAEMTAFASASDDRGARIVTAAAYASAVPQAQRPRMNVIVVLIESLRKDELTAEGGKRAVMPMLDSLARASTVYTDVVAPAAQSDYATTSILSSQFPLRNTAFRPFAPNPAYPRVLPYDILKPLGYRTAVFSSQNENWMGMYNFLNTGGVEHFLHAETFKGPTFSANADRGLHDWIEKTGHAGKIDDGDNISEAIAWTDSISRSTPFFAYVNLQSSHNPYLLMRKFKPRFGPGFVTFPVLFDVYPADSAGAVHDMYDNSLAYADLQLGRLFAALKKSGRWDSTVVAVLGDHGEAFYEHGFGAHGGQLFNEVTHVPLIMHVPGRTPAVDTLPASSLDVMPTILGILKLPPHPAYQGIDLARTAGRSDRLLFTLTQTGLADEVAIEQDQWKLIFDLRHSTPRVYDLRNDPGELHDVAAQFPAQRDALMGTMAEWWSRQIGYYRQLPARPEYYAPGAPRPAPLIQPAARGTRGP
ncbi:MAG: sulfatase [Gemmatimonadaceae bacterium]